jgi:hypothetical protein
MFRRLFSNHSQGHLQPAQIEAYLDKALPPEAMERVARHLRDCAHCQALAAQEADFIQALRNAPKPVYALSPQQTEKMYATISRRFWRLNVMNQFTSAIRTAVVIGLFVIVLGFFVWQQATPADEPMIEATPTTAVVVQPTPTATASPTSAPSTTPSATPSATPTDTPIPPTPEPTPTADPTDFMELFLPQCDRRPSEIERPTQPHPETGELWYEYRNEEYGFAFLFPPDWELIEGPYYICLNYKPRREVKFIIGFKWFDDNTQSIVRSGVAAGQLVTTGTVNVLGQEVDRNVLVYEGKDKAILYANAYYIRADDHDLQLTMSIDDFRIDYDAAELTPELMATADAIAESFSLIDRLYINDAYGFSFLLPPDWRIVDAFPNFLRLSYRPDRAAETVLTVGFKWEEEDEVTIVRSGTGALDELIEGEIEFMGQTISRNIWRYEDRTTAVFYANAYHINVDGLLFTLSLDYWDPRLIQQLSPEAMESADAIVESFRLTWEAEWRTVQVDDLGFKIDIPADWYKQAA